MRTSLQWMRLKDDSRNPIVQIEHRDYCGECKKHLKFIFGDIQIEIETDEAGLARIAAAIAEHPVAMVKAAEEKFNAAKRDFERAQSLISPVAETGRS